MAITLDLSNPVDSAIYDVCVLAETCFPHLITAQDEITRKSLIWMLNYQEAVRDEIYTDGDRSYEHEDYLIHQISVLLEDMDGCDSLSLEAYRAFIVEPHPVVVDDHPLTNDLIF